jgi:hypothetical protein
MTQQRRRIQHTASFAERLASEAEQFRVAAAEAKPGLERELLLKRARQAETAAHMNEWLSSPGLRSPK